MESSHCSSDSLSPPVRVGSVRTTVGAIQVFVMGRTLAVRGERSRLVPEGGRRRSPAEAT